MYPALHWQDVIDVLPAGDVAAVGHAWQTAEVMCK